MPVMTPPALTESGAAPITAPPPAATSTPAAVPPSVATAPAAATVAHSEAGVPRVSATDVDTSAIQGALDRYRSAFNALDAGAALEVWPTVNARTLARAFERLQQQDVSFERCQIEITGARAEAACTGTMLYVPRVGNRTAQVDRRHWTFSFLKVSDDWLIEGVDGR
jgi:hypothetical protein